MFLYNQFGTKFVLCVLTMKPAKGDLTKCSFETLIPFQENCTFFGQIEPFFGGQCHFTRQNRLLIDHSGIADAISVQRNDGKVSKTKLSLIPQF